MAYEIGADPQSESGDGHCASSHAIRIHLGKQHEYYCRDGYRTAEYISEEEEQHKGVPKSQRRACGEVDSYRYEAYDHSAYSPVDELFTSHLVDDEDCQYGGDHINQSHEHGREHRVVESGLAEDFRSVVKHGINAHKLAQDGDGASGEHGDEDARLEQILPRTVVRTGHGLSGDVDFVLNLGGVVIDFRENCRSLRKSSLDDEPLRTLRNEEDDEEEEQCRDGLATEHSAPSLCLEHLVPQGDVCACHERRVELAVDNPVDQVCQQESYRYGQLVQRHEGASDFSRRYFRDIDRGNDGYDTDTHAAYDSECYQGVEVCTDSATYRRNAEQCRRNEHRELASEIVAERPCDQYAADGAYEGAPYIPSFPKVCEMELAFNQFRSP